MGRLSDSKAVAIGDPGQQYVVSIEYEVVQVEVESSRASTRVYRKLVSYGQRLLGKTPASFYRTPPSCPLKITEQYGASR